jgi:hypothetical protein
VSSLTPQLDRHRSPHALIERKPFAGQGRSLFLCTSAQRVTTIGGRSMFTQYNPADRLNNVENPGGKKAEFAGNWALCEVGTCI